MKPIEICWFKSHFWRRRPHTDTEKLVSKRVTSDPETWTQTCTSWREVRKVYTLRSLFHLAGSAPSPITCFLINTCSFIKCQLGHGTSGGHRPSIRLSWRMFLPCWLSRFFLKSERKTHRLNSNLRTNTACFSEESKISKQFLHSSISCF